MTMSKLWRTYVGVEIENLEGHAGSRCPSLPLPATVNISIRLRRPDKDPYLPNAALTPWKRQWLSPTYEKNTCIQGEPRKNFHVKRVELAIYCERRILLRELVP